MPTSGSRETGSLPAASRPRSRRAAVVRRVATGRWRKFLRMGGRGMG